MADDRYYDDVGPDKGWRYRKGGDDAPFVTVIGTNELVQDASAVFASSSAQETTKNLDVDVPRYPQGDSIYQITVTNPSTVTDLTVIVRGKETLGGSAKYPELTRFTVPKSSPDGMTVLVQGWLMGEGGRLSISNQAALGEGEGFTAYVRIRKV